MTARALALVGLSLVLAGCESTGYTGIEFQPQPAQLESPLPGNDGQRVRAMATIVGVRKTGDPDQERVVDVRLRVDNESEATVAFDPRTMTLLDAKLQPFGEPMITSPLTDWPASIGPGDSAIVDAVFPFPAVRRDRVDLDSLTLRWQVAVADRRAMAFSTTFRRDFRAERHFYHPYGYYDPFWHTRWSYHDRYWWSPRHRHWYYGW